MRRGPFASVLLGNCEPSGHFFVPLRCIHIWAAVCTHLRPILTTLKAHAFPPQSGQKPRRGPDAVDPDFRQCEAEGILIQDDFSRL